MTAHRQVAILGGGPAGLTAAIYCGRADLHPIVIEGEPSSTSDQPGGQLMLTTEVENFPGFPQGIMGPDLMRDMRAQATRFGATFERSRVWRVDLSQRPFRLWTHDGDADPDVVAGALIIATGARSLMLGVPGEAELLGHGVSTCATCDGFFFRNKRIAVVGGGDSALEEATFLTKFAASVLVIHRRDTLRASKIMQDRAQANPRLQFRWSTAVTAAVERDGRLAGIDLVSTLNGDHEHLPVDGLFVAIGHRPNSDLFTGQLQLDGNGYVVTVPGTSRTSVDGVFACGDVQDHHYRQAITAAGSGCTAAIDTERWLQQQNAAETSTKNLLTTMIGSNNVYEVRTEGVR